MALSRRPTELISTDILNFVQKMNLNTSSCFILDKIHGIRGNKDKLSTVLKWLNNHLIKKLLLKYLENDDTLDYDSLKEHLDKFVVPAITNNPIAHNYLQN